jgi:polygalacturonase
MKFAILTGAFALVIFHAVLSEASAPVCDVTKNGAVGNGTTINTAAIQKTINQCPAGGIVLFPPNAGVFKTGTVILKSHITFRISPGTTLQGSSNVARYTALPGLPTNAQLVFPHAIVYASHVQDVVIDGGPMPTSGAPDPSTAGTIDGNGQILSTQIGFASPILVVSSTNVTYQNLQIKDAAGWDLVNVENDYVLINYLNIDSIYGTNRDGMDIVDSSNVTVQNTTIASEDDSVCLKSGSQTGIHNVLVRNIHIISGINALKFGTGSEGVVSGVHFQNIQIDRASSAAMAVESVDGSNVSNVSFNYINFNNVGAAIFLILGKRNTLKVGSMDSISFSNITGSTDRDYGSTITGTELNGVDHKITNVSLTNFHVKNTNDGGLKSIPPVHAEYGGEYPDAGVWGLNDAYGFFLRHIEGLTFTNVTVTPVSGDPRPKDVTIDVGNFIVR